MAGRLTHFADAYYWDGGNGYQGDEKGDLLYEIKGLGGKLLP